MDYIKRTEELVTPILERSGFELYDIEMLKESGAKVLRVYIDKDGGITSDDTADVCRELSDLIDRERDFIKEAYTLEVSSPGITRALKKPEHFSKNTGKDVEQVAIDTERDHYMSAQEALDYGLIDRIITNRSE